MADVPYHPLIGNQVIDPANQLVSGLARVKRPLQPGCGHARGLGQPVIALQVSGFWPSVDELRLLRVLDRLALMLRQGQYQEGLKEFSLTVVISDCPPARAQRSTEQLSSDVMPV